MDLRPRQKTRIQYYVGLSEEGIKYRDMIQKAADEACYEAWPMLTPPLEWEPENAVRGGYLSMHPGQISRLIHNDKGTQPSSEALDALHRAQSVPFKINPFIYTVEKALLAKSEEIGSFRTYEADSWEDLNKPRLDPRVWEQRYDHNKNELPEYKEARDHGSLLHRTEEGREDTEATARTAGRCTIPPCGSVLSADVLRHPAADVLLRRHRHPERL